VAGPLVAEDPGGRLALGQRGDEVDPRAVQVGAEAAGADRPALAAAGVDDHPVQRAQVGAEGVEHLEDPGMVGHVQLPDPHGDAGMGGQQLVAQAFQGVQAAGAERQVAAAGGELPGHLGAQAGAGAGDQDVAPDAHQRTAAAAARPAVRPENRQPPRNVPSSEL
jgi:hypothetical protein